MDSIILTYKELKSIIEFSETHNKANVYVTSEGCGGIGDIVKVQTQQDLWDKKDNFVDVSDYDSW